MSTGGIRFEETWRFFSKPYSLCLAAVSKPLQTLVAENPADVAVRGININLMEVMRLLMESETVLEWPASIDQVGGSLGFRTSDRAVSKR